MNPNEICICTHTLEHHSEDGCSRVFHNGTPCPCKEFALIDAGVDIYEALKKMVACCRADKELSPDVEFWLPRAEAAIRKAKGE